MNTSTLAQRSSTFVQHVHAGLVFIPGTTVCVERQLLYTVCDWCVAWYHTYVCMIHHACVVLEGWSCSYTMTSASCHTDVLFPSNYTVLNDAAYSHDWHVIITLLDQLHKVNSSPWHYQQRCNLQIFKTIKEARALATVGTTQIYAHPSQQWLQNEFIKQ